MRRSGSRVVHGHEALGQGQGQVLSESSIGALMPHDACDCSATPDAMCRRTNIGRTCVLNVWNIEENCMEKLETITARRSVTVLWYIDREWTADPSILWIVYTSIHLQRQYKGK